MTQAFDYKKQILEPIKSLRGAPREEMYPDTGPVPAAVRP
jgi:hypothetical protein